MPVIVGIAAVWTAIGGVTIAGVAVGAMVQSMIISAAVGFLAMKLGEEEADQAAEDYGIKLNTTSGAAPMVIVYGRRMVGGTEWRGTSGADNKYLHRIMVIGEGEIDGIEGVYFNDVNREDSDGLKAATTYTVHSGTDGQAADPDLIQALEDWGVDHRGYGVAYIYVRMTYNPDVFTEGMPTLNVMVRGRKVFDPRTGLTAWSENPALCLRDYWTNARFGVGIPESRIDDATFIDAANYCDELVTFKDSEGVEFQAPRYTCNGVLNPDAGLIENSRRLLLCCRGIPVYSGGKYKLVIDRPEISTFDFSEDNIIGAWTFSGASKRSTLNQVRVRFYDKSINWDESLTSVGSDEFLTADNGQVFEEDLFYPLIDDLARVDIMGQHHVKQARQGVKCSFTCTLEGFGVDVGDVVTLTHSTPGWDRKLFRVNELTLDQADVMRVVLSEYDPSVYTFDILQPPEVPDTNLPDPFDSPPPVNLSLQSGTDHLQVAPDSTVITRLLVEWGAPASSFVDRYEVGYKLSTNAGWSTIETSERQHYFVPVVEGHNYDVRVRAVYYSGARSPWLTRENYTIIGKTEPPAAPGSFSYASQRDYTREFTWTPNDLDLDVKGYSIRYSTTLTHTWDEMTTLHNGLLLSSPWETNLLNAGTYRFAIKTLDTSGNESTLARYITAELSDSPTSSIVYARYPRQEGWPGIITGVISAAGDLESNDLTTWDDLGAMTWDQFEEWGQNGEDLIYQFEDIDLGTILVFRPVVSVQAQGAVSYAIDYSEDGITWNGWTVPAADVSARYLRVKITVVHQEAIVNSMSILLDGGKETESITDLDTAALAVPARIAAGNIRLPLTAAFTSIKTVSVALQNTGPGWTWEVIDKDPVNGPQIKIYNNTGTLADATLDAIVIGY